MKNVTQFPACTEKPSGDVVALCCVHRTQFDAQPLQALFAHKEPHVAEEIVCRMLEDIALCLDQLQRGLAARDFDPMRRSARRIAVVARQIGLTEVAVTAGHVRTCLSQHDGIALEATLARLERGFDMAVNEVWQARDL